MLSGSATRARRGQRKLAPTAASPLFPNELPDDRTPTPGAVVTPLLRAGPAVLFRVDFACNPSGQPSGLAEESFRFFLGGGGLLHRLVKTIPRRPGKKRAGGMNARR